MPLSTFFIQLNCSFLVVYMIKSFLILFVKKLADWVLIALIKTPLVRTIVETQKSMPLCLALATPFFMDEPRIRFFAGPTKMNWHEKG